MTRAARSREAADEALTPERLAGARQPLERASTLPAAAFTAPAVYDREVERILSREWLCAARADQVPEPGDYLCLDLLGDRLVVVRDDDGAIRVLSRVCRHRGAELVQGSGNARSFQCPYHAWTYRLDGSLVGAPHMERAEAFDRGHCRLPELRSEVWEGWIFVNRDPDAEPLGPRLAPLSRRLARYGMAETVTLETACFDSRFNWKVLVDNFMEAYHHIAIRRETLEPLFPAARSHTPDSEGPYSLLVMPARKGAPGAPLDSALPHLGPLDDDEQTQLVAAVVFPFHLFALSAEALTWYQLLPEAVDRFTLRIHTCFPREALDDPALRKPVEGIQAFTRLVHNQDIAACEAVQAGLADGSFTSGRLCPLEKPIWEFNQWWIERMAEAGG
ncbi:MAG: aromatic ring-hydroxylating dioxygenase subunit alpha [Myxococcota bacterium]|nr:aromatic ring-hydroxylating dioxygenase subunit alpha [Myxococcota bacterium]